MAPTKTLKTYKRSTGMSSSVDAFNSLFVQNLTHKLITKKKVKKRKIIIKELPKQTKHGIFNDDSLQVSTEDTFDKLKKAINVNLPTKNIEKNTLVGLSGNNSLIVQKHSTNDLTKFSPIITRSRLNNSKSLQETSDVILQRFKEDTFDAVKSIEIEKEIKQISGSLSYIKLPSQTKSDSKEFNNSEANICYFVNDSNKIEESFSKLFPNSFFEKQPAKCSTPVHSIKNRVLSPIKAVRSILKESFDEIKKCRDEFSDNPCETRNSPIEINDSKSYSQNYINLRKRKIFKLDYLCESVNRSNNLSLKSKNLYEITTSNFTKRRGVNSAKTFSNTSISKQYKKYISTNHQNVNNSVMSSDISNICIERSSAKHESENVTHSSTASSPSLNSDKTNDSNAISKHTTKLKMDVKIDLTKTDNIFQTVYKNHYSGMSLEQPNSLSINDTPLDYKDIKNLARSVDISSDFNNKMESETHVRGNSQSHIINNILKELIVHVTRGSFHESTDVEFIESSNSDVSGISVSIEQNCHNSCIAKMQNNKINNSVNSFTATSENDYIKSNPLLQSYLSNDTNQNINAKNNSNTFENCNSVIRLTSPNNSTCILDSNSSNGLSQNGTNNTYDSSNFDECNEIINSSIEINDINQETPFTQNFINLRKRKIFRSNNINESSNNLSLKSHSLNKNTTSNCTKRRCISSIKTCSTIPINKHNKKHQEIFTNSNTERALDMSNIYIESSSTEPETENDNFSHLFNTSSPNFNNDQTNDASSISKNTTKMKMDVKIHLTKNDSIFESFHKNQYSEMSSEQPNSVSNNCTPLHYKDIIINLTRQDDTVNISGDFNNKIECETHLRENSESHIISNILKELIVNVTKGGCGELTDAEFIENSNGDISNKDCEYNDSIMKINNEMNSFTTTSEYDYNKSNPLLGSNLLNEPNPNINNFENYKNVNRPTSPNNSTSILDSNSSNGLSQNGTNNTYDSSNFDECNEMEASLNGTNNTNNSSNFENRNSSENHINCNTSQNEIDHECYISNNSEPSIQTSNDKTKMDGDQSIVNLTESVCGNVMSVVEQNNITQAHFKVPKPIMLKPGKLWRRSLLIYKKSICSGESKEEFCISKTGDSCKCQKCNVKSVRRSSMKIIPLNLSNSKNIRRTTLLGEYIKQSSYVPETFYEENLENSIRSLSLIEEKSHILDVPPAITARDIVLRKCGQADPIEFQECYSESYLRNCQKIGEGVYGEVFLLKNPTGGTSVLKIIPIEGSLIVNGEKQKKFNEILSEIIIASELSNLRYKKSNSTNAFNQVQEIKCVRGNYPRKLLELWDLFEETRGSENDCPDAFPPDQLYIVLQLANGGKDLESYVFNNAVQAYAMFEQVAFALAVAETELNFEHRDLHWGNVLLTTVEKNATVTYKLNGQTYEIFTRGVEVSIIDFTLSRIQYEGVVMFNDLAMDEELFTGDGDYQFEIYKLMKKKNRNDWQKFEPYSNLLWLHYILEKAVSALRYKYTQSKIHKEYTAKIQRLYNEILNYKSTKDFVLSYVVAQ